MRDALSYRHPLVALVYFILVIGGAMYFMHPVALMIALLGGLCYARSLGRLERGLCCLLLPMALLAAVINPLFNHGGSTILCYLPWGNPLTLESILYGLAAGAMLCAVVLWFVCYTAVMTSDKFIYLFGRMIPALSLILSMALRFVPRFRHQMAQVMEGQRSLGREENTLFDRLRLGATTLSIMITWSLENAIETADSMKSRGYGLEGRTAFSIYCWGERDGWAMAWLALSGSYLIYGALAGALDYRYHPSLSGGAITPLGVSVWVIYLALALTPLGMNGLTTGERRGDVV